MIKGFRDRVLSAPRRGVLLETPPPWHATICSHIVHSAYFTKYELLSSLIFVTDVKIDRQTESDAYEPTMQFAQVGSNINCIQPLYFH